MAEKLRAYQGTDKYLFVSYAHRDAADVMPALEALSDGGYRAWYDEGIPAGSEWAETIGTALGKASLVVFFASDTSLRRDNVMRELKFAREHGIPILTVQLGKVDFPEELGRMLLVEQTADLSRYATYGDFVRGIKNVLDKAGVGGGVTVPDKEKKITFHRVKKRRKKLLTALVCLIAAATVCFAGYKLLFLSVPEVVGFAANDAVNALTAAGLSGNLSMNYSDEYDYGVVFDQSAHGIIFRFIPVVITQSLGPQEDLTDVPDTVGRHVSDGATLLVQAGMTKFAITPTESAGTEKAHILSQSIPAGLRVSRKNTIGLDVATDGGEIIFEIDGVEVVISGTEPVTVDIEKIKEEALSEEPLYRIDKDGTILVYNVSALYKFTVPPVRDDNGDVTEKSEYDNGDVMIKIMRTMTVTREVETLATVIVPDGVHLVVGKNGNVTCASIIEARGRLTVRSGGFFGTTMAGFNAMRNYGKVYVEEGGTLATQYGGHINNMTGGNMQIDGLMRVCCINEMQWFVNDGDVTGTGTVDLTDVSNPEYGDGTDMEAMSLRMLNAIGKDTALTIIPAPPAVDEYGMLTKERALYDALDYPWIDMHGNEGSPAIYPFVDPGDVKKGVEGYNVCFIARSMRIQGQPGWVDGYFEFIVAPGVTLALEGDGWNGTDLGITVMEGGTLNVRCRLENVQFIANHGTVCVDGSDFESCLTYGEFTDESGNEWGKAANDGVLEARWGGKVIMNQIWSFAGAEERCDEGEIAVDTRFDFSDTEPPFTFVNGPRGFQAFTLCYRAPGGKLNEKWWE
ncbi:MAG: TIR domain-containing protein [Clostridia bacterium]|nr:TIR domain-containing protein [Clostridia bacterium]